MTNRIMELADAYAEAHAEASWQNDQGWIAATIKVANAQDAVARAALQAEVEQLTAELQEQARVNGMGGEREAALMAKVEQLTAERNFCPRCGKRLVGDGIHTCTPPHNIETDPAKIRAAFEGDEG